MKHKQIHEKMRNENYICDICAKTFVSESNLRIHMGNHRDTPKPKVQCDICQLWYKNIETLRSHKRIHRDTTEYICVTCNKHCATKSSLSAHVRYVHIKVEKFECTICSKKFRRNLELREHMARHNGQSLYQCQFCPKSFITSSNYFSHRKSKHSDKIINKNK